MSSELPSVPALEVLNLWMDAARENLKQSNAESALRFISGLLPGSEVELSMGEWGEHFYSPPLVSFKASWKGKGNGQTERNGMNVSADYSLYGSPKPIVHFGKTRDYRAEGGGGGGSIVPDSIQRVDIGDQDFMSILYRYLREKVLTAEEIVNLERELDKINTHQH